MRVGRVGDGMFWGWVEGVLNLCWSWLVLGLDCTNEYFVFHGFFCWNGRG